MREAPPENADDVPRLVHRERRLGDVGKLRVGGKVERFRLLDSLYEDRRIGRLAGRSDDLLVTRVPDEDDRVALVRVPAGLDVHLRDERTSRVDDVVAASCGVLVDGGCDAVSRVHERRAHGDLRLLVDEDRSARLEVADDVDVVDDLLADVHGGAVVLERLLDSLDGAFDARAVAARRREENTLDHRPTA